MILVDTALRIRAQAGEPVRVGLIGAGFMARGIANQIENSLPGMELVAIANRTIERAKNAWQYAEASTVKEVVSVDALEANISSGVRSITDDATLLCHSPSVDVLIESTGSVEFGAKITLEAINSGKDIVLMNAELDGTIGPYLKVLADRKGVIYTGCDGDQPGVQLNLLRFVESIGMRPRVSGNIKGMLDRNRNPTTQRSFASKWKQTPSMVTSFADGTKISFEQAVVANATGMRVSKRGMNGWNFDGQIDGLTSKYNIEQLREIGGIVDYVVGAVPSPGVYVFAEVANEKQSIYLDYGKLGKGPLYSFYVPYHLTVLEVPLSAARVALYRDYVITPLNKPMVDVLAAAKVDMTPGDRIDFLGGYKTYGFCENADTAQAHNLLPIGIAEGAVVKRSIAKDQALTYADVDLPDNICVKLRQQQDQYFYPIQ